LHNGGERYEIKTVKRTNEKRKGKGKFGNKEMRNGKWL
jgi:hypothetical protein